MQGRQIKAPGADPSKTARAELFSREETVHIAKVINGLGAFGSQLIKLNSLDLRRKALALLQSVKQQHEGLLKRLDRMARSSGDESAPRDRRFGRRFGGYRRGVDLGETLPLGFRFSRALHCNLRASSNLAKAAGGAQASLTLTKSATRQLRDKSPLDASLPAKSPSLAWSPREPSP